MEILVIDGQGGRIGQQLIKAILTRYPQVEVTAIGTNSLATSAMLKGGASQGPREGTPCWWPAAGRM